MPKVALVHDWLVSPGGGERVLKAIHELWPEAPIYTAAYEPAKFPEFSQADIRPTWLNRIALSRRKHQLFALPRILAFRMLNLGEYDLVISSSTAEGKGARVGRALHVCYCHTPTRYYWSDYEWYRKNPPFGPIMNRVAPVVLLLLAPLLRKIDFASAQKVDVFVANSKYVQARIKKYYQRESTVIYPPVDAARFSVGQGEGDYYLIVGRQVAYKRLDVAVGAFNRLGLPLKVAGGGEEIEKQRQLAKKNIEFLGRVPEEELAQLYRGAKALIFPQEEDFGIVPLEAMASGRPVIAYGAGGALETVVDGTTGVFFAAQTGESLADAVRKFQQIKFDAQVIRRHAEKFDVGVFKKQLKDFVQAEYKKRRIN